MPPLSRGTKIFHSRSSSPSLFSSRLPIFCLLIGIAGLIVGLVSFTTSLRAKSCNSRQPRSVSVVWERGDTSTGSRAVSVEDVKRHKVMGFVGVFTGFGSVGRRRALRQTWFPSDKQGLERLEEATGLAVRFVIGKTKENWKMAQLQKEVAAYDDFLLLDMEEHYNKLPYKTLAFFKAAYALYDSEFYVKADDDIYLRPGDYYKIRIPKLLACFTNLTSGYYFTTTDRLSLLLVKERSNPQTYIGCMKKGPVFTDPNLKWHEPLAHLLGSEYFLHAYGPIYALSASVVRSLGALRNDSFRMFSNEDVTIGSWMLAMNVNYENEKTLCEPECTNSSIAIWDIPKCSGLCDPEKKMPELHKMEACSNSPTLTSDG